MSHDAHSCGELSNGQHDQLSDHAPGGSDAQMTRLVARKPQYDPRS
jgi:hypothetical protein